MAAARRYRAVMPRMGVDVVVIKSLFKPCASTGLGRTVFSEKSSENGNLLNPFVLYPKGHKSWSGHERNLKTGQLNTNQDCLSLKALTAAALILPGLFQPTAQAVSEDDSVDFQYSHYQEGKRDVAGNDLDSNNNFSKLSSSSQYNPIEVDSLHGSAKITLSDRVKFAFNYTQDTWSGATPVSTAPAASNANHFFGKIGGTISSASPFIKDFQAFFDAQGNPLRATARNPATGQFTYVKDKQLTHILSSASPETRNQGDFKLSYQWDEAALDIGGGISMEPDYESRFGNLGVRWDFNQKLTSVNVGLSYTNSDTHATLDPVALPYLSISDKYQEQVEVSLDRKNAMLRGNRQDWGAHFGIAQVINKSALLEVDGNYTRSTGFMANPYKVFNIYDLMPSSDGTPGVFQGIASAYIEQRPDIRDQWSVDTRYVQYIAPLDAAMHFSYRYFHDNWGIDAHTFESDWMQPLGQGWTVTPRIRYYSQDAADFYHPFIVNSGSGGAGEGSSSVKASENFSNDQRLSGYGALSGGITVNKQFAKGLSLETGFEYYTHSGSLKLGGGGEGSYSDFNYFVANAALKLNLSALASHVGGSSDSGNRRIDGDNYQRHHHHHNNAPAGILFSHMIDKADGFMVGYRYMRNRDTGDMLHGTGVANSKDLLGNGCAGFQCLVQPLEMSMNMHMLDLMYAPTDWLNLMLMPQFVDMNMSVGSIPGAPPPSTGGGTHNHGSKPGSHATGGVGDTGMYALVKLFDRSQQQVHLGLGFSAPTGDVGIKLRNTKPSLGSQSFIHYGMQLGSGTWDFKPSLTYNGQYDDWSWGAQLSGIKRLESKNKSGFAFGDIFQTSVWGGYQLTNWLSASVRGVYTWQGTIKGQYPFESKFAPDYCSNRHNFEFPDGAGGVFFDEASFRACPASVAAADTKLDAERHSGTFDQPSNYGGHYWDVGFGLNVNIPEGAFAGNSLGFEWLQPVYTNVNGYQLDRDGALAVNWNYAF